MKNNFVKRDKVFLIITLLLVFFLGAAASTAYSTGTLTAYLSMIGAIVVALAISYGILKLLFHAEATSESDELKLDEFPEDENEIRKAHK